MQHIASYFDPLIFCAVWLGAIMIVSLQEGGAGLVRSFSVWKILAKANPDYDADIAYQALQRARWITDSKGLQCLDRIHSDSDFATRAMNRLSDTGCAGNFRIWLSNELNAREARHNIAIRFWLALSDIAPAIGMIGTIIGLIGMFAQAGDAMELGGAMAIALLTTLYGLILSNVIAAPIAQRLLRLSTEELKWQRIFGDELIALAQSQDARTTRAMNAKCA